ncbi:MULTISPECIES: tetratricopeptide repeat protein [unclassified Moraxella]|uniref:tetratricopeptide repeat protein n=1 Tax=unclassified Moraxella TaxID=2685852 RepID=UPI003AF6961C
MTDTQAQADFLRYAELAEQGDAEAQYQTGQCYAKGLGVAQNYHQSAHYWLMSAKQQHPLAQVYLGTLFEKGLGVAQDFVKSAQCYQVASQQNLAIAKVRLAMLYLKGQGVPHDPKQAIALFIQSAEQGEPTAQYNLAVAYEKGLGGLTPNDQQALFWYQQAEQQGYPQATQVLQQAKFTDLLNVQANISSNTLTHISSSTPTPTADNGEALFEQGVALLGQDLAGAMDVWRKSAEQGHAKAQYNLGVAHLCGISQSEPNIDRAVEYLKQSAEQAFRPAHLVLGWLYQGGATTLPQSPVGSSLPIDHELALGYYEVASELGNPQAQYFLYQMYATGNGVDANQEVALTWLRQSAKQGYGKAFERLEALDN